MNSSVYGGVSGGSIYGNVGVRVGVLVDFNAGKVTFYNNGRPTNATAAIQKGIDYWPLVVSDYILKH